MALKLSKVLQNRKLPSKGLPIFIAYKDKEIAKKNHAVWDREIKVWMLPGNMDFEEAKKAYTKIFKQCKEIPPTPFFTTLGYKPLNITNIDTDEQKEMEKALEIANQILQTNPEKIVCFDTETTGFSKYDEILQISMYGTSGPILNSYFKPQHRKTWNGAAAVNHIYPETVKNAPSFEASASKLQKIFSKAEIIIGHNVAFDEKMVTNHGVNLNHAIILDTLELFKEDVPKGSHKLIDAVTYYCPNLLEKFEKGAHDADIDTWATIEVFKKQMEKRFPAYDKTIPDITFKTVPEEVEIEFD